MPNSTADETLEKVDWKDICMYSLKPFCISSKPAINDAETKK